MTTKQITICAHCKYYQKRYQGEDYPSSQQCTHPSVRIKQKPHHISGKTPWPYPNCKEINTDGNCKLFKQSTILDDVFWKYKHITSVIVYCVLIITIGGACALILGESTFTIPLMIICMIPILIFFCYLENKMMP